MSGVTGIELGPTACVVVRTGRDGSAPRAGRRCITASETVAARDREELVEALRSARRDQGFSSRARVVAWSGPGSQVVLDVDHLPDVSSLVAAGFDVEAVVSPPQALALMVESQHIDSRRSAVAAVSLNTHGAAIAIVHHGAVVSARTFEWTLGVPFAGSRSELLERYLVIAQLAPQLRHLIELAAPVYNATVTSVVVCGNLPDLRSLSMLLIEEMDMEVETLDSAEQLASADALQSDSVASLQLAAAVSTSVDPPLPASAGPIGADVKPASSSSLRRVVGSIAFVLCGAWTSLQVAGSAPAAPMFPSGLAVASAQAAAPPASAVLGPRPEATIGRVETPPAPVVAEPNRATPLPRRDRRVAVPPAPPLAEPLPRVEGIAISGQRQLAILDGAIVGVGDRVGSRLVVRIDRHGVLLREPSGWEVFVAIRTRKPPPDGL